MVDRHSAGAFDIEPLPVLTGDAKIRFYDCHRGDAPEAYDEFRAYQIALCVQPVTARRLLLVERVAVVRRTAFDDVRNVYARAVEIDHFQHVVEQLAGRADERLALQILLFTGAFADEHQLALRIANAENNVVPSLRKRAVPAGAAFSLQFVHCFHDHHTPYPDIVSCFAGKGNARIGQKRDAPRTRRVPLCREDILREADRDHTLKSTEVEPLFSCTNS